MRGEPIEEGAAGFELRDQCGRSIIGDERNQRAADESPACSGVESDTHVYSPPAI